MRKQRPGFPSPLPSRFARKTNRLGFLIDCSGKQRKNVLRKFYKYSIFHEMNYRVTLVESEEGFAVWCDDLSGCNSQGATREEALQNIRIAISEYQAAQPEIEKCFGTSVRREEVSV
jgi:predicted RNase H-like HicB family nuclease